MKKGFRTPSLKKSVSARTTGRLTRSMKKATNPLYGKKGMGLINDPERAVKNKIYRETTFGVNDVVKATSGKSKPKRVLKLFWALIGIVAVFFAILLFI